MSLWRPRRERQTPIARSVSRPPFATCAKDGARAISMILARSKSLGHPSHSSCPAFFRFSPRLAICSDLHQAKEAKERRDEKPNYRGRSHDDVPPRSLLSQ
jgi:hypothetical protein